MSDQTIQIKYVGTEQRWPELSITGRQSAWMPGQIESRSPSEASALLATGLFSSLPVPVTAATSPGGGIEFSVEGENMNLVRATTSPGGEITDFNVDGKNIGLVQAVTSPGGGVGLTAVGEPVFGVIPDSLGPSYVAKLIAANPNDGKMRVRVGYFDSLMTQGVEAVVRIANDKYLVYRIGREAIDGLMRLYSGWVADKSMSEVVSLTNSDVEPNLINLTFSSPAFSATTTGNPYTLVAETELSFSFTGTGLDLVTYSSNAGGLWRVEIDDGAVVKDFSVWRESSGKITTQIARGMSLGSHSVKMTFLGEDPENPTASPRGWVSSALTSDGATMRSNAMIRVANIEETYTKVQDLSFVGNVSEAAIKWRKNGSAYDTTFWPSHGDNNVTSIVSQTVYIDGAPTSLATPELGYNDAYQIDVAQSFTVQNPNEPDEKLANGLMLSRMTAAGYEFACQFDLLQAVNVSSAYVCTPGCYNSDVVQLNSGQSANTSAHDDNTETMTRIADSALMYADDHPYAWAYKMHNWRASTRAGKSDHVPSWTRVQARLQGTRASKVYNYIQDGSSVVWPAGERLTFGAHFCGGLRPTI